MFEHAKGDADDLMHDGTQGAHFGFAAFHEVLIALMEGVGGGFTWGAALARL